MVNFEVQETILEYLFRSLRLSPADTGVEEHPILMTEAYLNPNYCRSGIGSRNIYFQYQRNVALGNAYKIRIY